MGIATSALLYSVSPIEHADQESLANTEEPIDEEIQTILHNWESKMTHEASPGRPGTLSPEEEEKLREFWVAALKVFGVLGPKDVNGADPEALARSNTSVSSKKKEKKRWFRRGKDEDVAAPAKAADGEEKYGQTEAFKKALASMSPEVLRNTFWSMVKHDHPDGLLLRFLRARKWNVENALVMMVSTMRWRAEESHVDDDIMRNGELQMYEWSQSDDPVKAKFGNDFLDQERKGKSFIHGLDKDNRPMCLVRARLHRAGEQSNEALERFTVYIIESTRLLVHPPVDTGVSP